MSDLAAVLRGTFRGIERRVCFQCKTKVNFFEEERSIGRRTRDIPHICDIGHIADPHILLMMVSDLSMGRRTREEKTERREVKVVSLLYSSSVQWNILLDIIIIL